MAAFTHSPTYLSQYFLVTKPGRLVHVADIPQGQRPGFGFERISAAENRKQQSPEAAKKTPTTEQAMSGHILRRIIMPFPPVMRHCKIRVGIPLFSFNATYLEVFVLYTYVYPWTKFPRRYRVTRNYCSVHIYVPVSFLPRTL